MSADQGKLKLLCLHGYLQNSEVFKSRIGSLRKALKSRVEFVFIDAPFESQGLPGADEADEVQGVRDGRSWWNWTDTGPAGRPSKAANYTGWEATYAALCAALREHRPDGLLGFSQGATASALLLANLASAPPEAAGGEPVPLPRCAVLVAGFLPRDPAYAELAAKASGSSVPCLFVTGTSDALVPPERTQQLADCFSPSCVSIYQHGGAHLVPTCSGDFKAAVVAFLDAVKGGGPVAPVYRVSSQLALSTSASASSLGGGSAAGAAEGKGGNSVGAGSLSAAGEDGDAAGKDQDVVAVQRQAAAAADQNAKRAAAELAERVSEVVHVAA